MCSRCQKCLSTASDILSLMSDSRHSIDVLPPNSDVFIRWTKNTIVFVNPVRPRRHCAICITILNTCHSCSLQLDTRHISPNILKTDQLPNVINGKKEYIYTSLTRIWIAERIILEYDLITDALRQ